MPAWWFVSLSLCVPAHRLHFPLQCLSPSPPPASVALAPLNSRADLPTYLPPRAARSLLISVHLSSTRACRAGDALRPRALLAAARAGASRARESGSGSSSGSGGPRERRLRRVCSHAVGASRPCLPLDAALGGAGGRAGWHTLVRLCAG
eukprot:3278387-Pleurochrysis_carterae.AAC.1